MFPAQANAGFKEGANVTEFNREKEEICSKYYDSVAKCFRWLMFELLLASGGVTTRKAVSTMTHYLYATRGGYLYLVGRYNSAPKADNEGEFVLSVPEKTPQAAIDSLAHRRFMEHLRRPRRAHAHNHHRNIQEAATV